MCQPGDELVMNWPSHRACHHTQAPTPTPPHQNHLCHRRCCGWAAAGCAQLLSLCCLSRSRSAASAAAPTTTVTMVWFYCDSCGDSIKKVRARPAAGSEVAAAACLLLLLPLLLCAIALPGC